MLDTQKEALIRRADRFADKLKAATYTNEHSSTELNILIESIVYALVTVLDWKDEKEWNEQFNLSIYKNFKADSKEDFEQEILNILELLDNYKAFIAGL